MVASPSSRGPSCSSSAGETTVRVKVSELAVCRDALVQAETAAEHMARLANSAAQAFATERSTLGACVKVLNKHLGIASQRPPF